MKFSYRSKIEVSICLNSSYRIIQNEKGRKNWNNKDENDKNNDATMSKYAQEQQELKNHKSIEENFNNKNPQEF